MFAFQAGEYDENVAVGHIPYSLIIVWVRRLSLWHTKEYR